MPGIVVLILGKVVTVAFNWGDAEDDLFIGALENVGDQGKAYEMLNDEWLQFLYHESLFDRENMSTAERANVYESLEAYVLEEYGIDFSEIYDWEAYREAYDTASA